MTQRSVITSGKAAYYHVDASCPGLVHGQTQGAVRGHDLHPPVRVGEADAIRQGKRKCLRCGASQ